MTYEGIMETLAEAGVSEARQRMLRPIAENVAFMCQKLTESRRDLEAAELTVEYNNGGGQEGIRENPLIRAYEALWKSYMVGMSKILDALPAESRAKVEQEEPERPQTVLEIIRGRHA